MGQSPSRPQNHSVSAPTSPCTPNHPRRFNRTRSAVRRSWLKLAKPSRSNADKTSRRRSWFGPKASSRPTSTVQPTTIPQPVSDRFSGESSSSSAPSSPSISTPQTSATPQGYRPIEKVPGPVVEFSPASFEETGESSGVDVLTPTRNLSRRPSRLEPTASAGPCPPEDRPSPVINPVHEEPSHPSLSPRPSPFSEESTTTTPPAPSTNSTAHATTTPTSNPQTTPPARQFPPPGTLVLVQGVVQTTDVPRPPNTDNLPEMNTTRPRSPSEAGHGSSLAPSGPHFTSVAPASEVPEQPEHEFTTQEGAAEPAVPTRVHEQAATSTPEPQPRPSPATPPNGVEVLGTLLSVAAAATAASLLAGSAENVFSPARLNSTARSSEVPDLSLTARRERMRHAWQSVRERLGLRPSAPSTTPPTDGQQVDAREVMLAEMARAFNLGLGISPEIEEPSASMLPGPTSEPESTSAPASPPPGSFEQFLADLQNDLRGVLNEADAPAREEVQESTQLPAEAPSTPEPMVEAPSSAESASENGEEAGARNVNWWRMYRFPQMNARNSVPTPASPAESPTMDVAPSPPAADATGISGNVVPIVVVGLRSVNMPGQIPTPEPLTPAAQPSMAGSDSMPGSWPSRAASALRNLRPGRRDEQRPDTPTSPSAPRTFLIFVIGGYYPPDHNMVTGGENSLASFEALLELAEMFGQNKPQTASKDDIERSGLEIIKATDLPKYEQEGKIASNCTDRCLICLDDYEPEDPVRIMSCRHGFHKSCVDRWLETGRNNCPACRSAGVNTDISASV